MRKTCVQIVRLAALCGAFGPLAGCRLVASPPPAPEPAPVPAKDEEAVVESTPAAAETASAPPAAPAPSPPAANPDERSAPPTEAVSLLAALRASFQLEHHVEQPQVRKALATLATHSTYPAGQRLGLREHLPYIHQQVRKRDMPGELSLLPLIESDLDPLASFQGAVGLWQFMPDTARRFGLRMDPWVDERRDVVQATEAALDYLGELHAQYGDWLLALAAYNCGEACIDQALRRSRSSRFFDLAVPQVTVRHVARLLAHAAAFADPARFGVELPLAEADGSAIPFAAVAAAEQVDLARLARALGCDPEDLRQRNPALKQGVTHPRGPHRLLVDAGDEQAAIRAITDLGSPSHTPDVYVVVRGDSLWAIARRFGVNLQSLMGINALGPQDILPIGRTLLLPDLLPDLLPE